MPKYRVMVAQFPGNNSTHPAASDYVAAVMYKMSNDPRIGVENVVPWRKSDTPITMTRNLCLVAAEMNRCDYVVMIDSDMGPDCVSTENGGKPFWESSWEFMLANPKAGMIAAPYCGPSPSECVYVFRWNSDQDQIPNPNARIEMYDRHTASFLSGIKMAAALPTGLCIINMRAVADMPHPRFEYEWKDHKGDMEKKCQTCGHPIPHERVEKASTEDVFFSRNMQSGCRGKPGWPIYCNWDAWAVHYKLTAVGPPRRLPMDFFPQSSRRWADEAPPLGMADPYPTPEAAVEGSASDTAPDRRNWLSVNATEDDMGARRVFQNAG